MSKLQDKLAASVRQARTAPATKVPAKRNTTPRAVKLTGDTAPPSAPPAAPRTAAEPRSATPRFDFPERVWPD